MGREAQEKLNVPPYPEETEYLIEYAYALLGRSGEGFEGWCRVSPVVIEAHFRMIGIEPEPWEVEAIYALDDALLNPGEWDDDKAGGRLEAEDESGPPQSRNPHPVAWPTRKAPAPILVNKDIPT